MNLILATARVSQLRLTSTGGRAERFSPDMFYVNEFAERLKLHDAEVFDICFDELRFLV